MWVIMQEYLVFIFLMAPCNIISNINIPVLSPLLVLNVFRYDLIQSKKSEVALTH